jgi:ribose 1,5-bisphosphokinase
MSGRLLYVMGPSGAGKDSLMGWLKERLSSQPAVYWAQRTIDRPRSANDALHEALTSLEFFDQQTQGCFALYWHANGHQYGIRKTELHALHTGAWVVVNGSREYLPALLQNYPDAMALHITAPTQTLRQRLLARGRESFNDVEARLQRAVEFTVPPNAQTLEFVNNGLLEDCGLALVHALQKLPGFPMSV